MEEISRDVVVFFWWFSKLSVGFFWCILLEDVEDVEDVDGSFFLL